MSQLAPERNPFMLMINPEVVFAAMEASERLGQLNRHLCRPLDRVMPVGGDALASAQAEGADEDGAEDSAEDSVDGGGDDGGESVTLISEA